MFQLVTSRSDSECGVVHVVTVVTTGMFLVQSQCMYFEAEAAVVALKHRKASIAPPCVVPDASTPTADGEAADVEAGAGSQTQADGGTDATDTMEEAAAADVDGAACGEGNAEGQIVRAPAVTVEELQQTVAAGFVKGMQKALDCQKPWAVINGAVYCWNAYLGSMQEGWCAAMGSAA